MAEATRSRFWWLSSDVRRIGSDLAEMFVLRRQLAEEEIRSDLAAARRLALVGGAGVVLAWTGLPLLLVALALQLEDSLRAGPAAWTLLATGASALLLGLAAVRAAWRRFQADFVGLRDSMAELREDLAWLRERMEEQE